MAVKQRVESDNYFARYNRELKASRLAGMIVKLAGNGVTPLEVFGRLTPEQWRHVEVLIGQRRPKVPSPATQLLVLERLREHAAGGVS